MPRKGTEDPMADAPEVIKLKYVGDRFTGGRLPVDVLTDLPAFRDLLVAFAKETWLQQNKGRQRVPKGFERSIAFDLVGVEDGSAVPCLRWDRDAAQSTLPGFSDSLGALIEDSYARLVKLVDEAGIGIYPTSLSPGHIKALDKFGAGLRPGERIEFDGIVSQNDNVVYLDSQRRKELVTHVKETYVTDFEGTGRLIGNQENGIILIETERHGTISVFIGTDAVKKGFDGSLGSDVQFNISVELDHADKIRSVVGVTYVDLVDDEAVNELQRCLNRIEELRKLEDGWEDGDGLSISTLAIDNALQLINRRAVLSPMFRIYPTSEGGVLFEFKSNGWDFSVEFHAEGTVEMYGVEIAGQGEMSPALFDTVADDFASEFDAKVAR